MSLLGGGIADMLWCHHLEVQVVFLDVESVALKVDLQNNGTLRIRK